jgi:hypothetical protein
MGESLDFRDDVEPQRLGVVNDAAHFGLGQERPARDLGVGGVLPIGVAGLHLARAAREVGL